MKLKYSSEKRICSKKSKIKQSKKNTRIIICNGKETKKEKKDKGA